MLTSGQQWSPNAADEDEDGIEVNTRAYYIKFVVFWICLQSRTEMISIVNGL